ncbi:MAG: PAS domain S-box protein [Thermodesulfobacteriota bacterium]|nr:PAS domain S-box protein [Thermodesulfobacteriota bacterium]
MSEIKKKLEQECAKRQKAEEAFWALEDMYKTFLKTFPDAAVITDLQGNITQVSEQTLQLFGYDDVNEIIGMSILKFVAPEDHTKVLSSYRKVLKEVFIKSTENIFIKKNETRFIGESDASFVADTHGKYTAFMAIIKDVTEHKKSEKEIKALKNFNENIIENSPIGIFVIDMNYKVKAWNSWFEDLTGRKKEVVLNKNLFNVIPEPAKKDWNEIYQKVIETGEAIETNEHKYVMHSGPKAETSLYFNFKIVPFKKGGRIFGAITVVEDVTAYKQAKDELLQSRELLFQAQKMEALGTLMAGVAHEINNPLNLIMYNIPLLKKIWEDFDPILEEFSEMKPKMRYGGLTYDFLKENLPLLLSDTDMAANRMARIVSDFKNFAKQSNVIDKEPIQINTAVENAIRLVGSTLKKSSIDLKLCLQDNLPHIEGNLQSIEQIVLNLTLNAAQAIDHERGEIEVFTGFDEKDGRIFVSISDNGRGIEPSISDKLFDPFVTDRQDQGGSGMGLSVTYTLMKAHDGEITFESTKGKGTTFKVFFPTLLAEKQAKILVVDDDEMIRDLLIEAFTNYGSYTVEEATNGLEACIKLGTYHPDILIIDIVMPKMDGLEICRILKEQPELSDIGVLITTGFPDDQRVKEVMELGFTNIHFKPFDIAELFQVTDRILKEKGYL